MGHVTDCVHCRATITRGWSGWYHIISDERTCRGAKTVATPPPDFRTEDEVLAHLRHLAKLERDLHSDRLATLRAGRQAGVTWQQLADALGEDPEALAGRYAHRLRKEDR